MNNRKALFICEPYSFENAYSAEEKREIGSLTDLIAERQDADVIEKNPDLLSEVEVLFTGWSPPAIDSNFLKMAPRLKAVFHAAGSIKMIVASEDFWKRGIMITSAYEANSIPVAEFCLAQIFLSLKRYWFFTNASKLEGSYLDQKEHIVPGGYKSKVGIITMGTISKILVEYLRPFSLDLLVYSRSMNEEQIKDIGGTKATIDQIFQESDVVSLHTPLLEPTKRMIRGSHFRSMKENATFINTARGGVVDECEMIAVAKEREDLTFLLDVIDPEPPEANSDIMKTRNIIVSPHIAGSLGRECQRMGKMMTDELKNYLNDEPLNYQITQEDFQRMA